MQKHKPVGDHRRVDDWRNLSSVHSLMGRDQSRHQVRKVLRFWGDKVNKPVSICDRLPDVILGIPVVAFREPRIHIPFRFTCDLPLSGSVFQSEHPERQNLPGGEVHIIPDNKIGILPPLFPASDLYLPVVDQEVILRFFRRRPDLVP